MIFSLVRQESRAHAIMQASFTVGHSPQSVARSRIQIPTSECAKSGRICRTSRRIGPRVGKAWHSRLRKGVDNWEEQQLFLISASSFRRSTALALKLQAHIEAKKRSRRLVSYHSPGHGLGYRAGD